MTWRDISTATEADGRFLAYSAFVGVYETHCEPTDHDQYPFEYPMYYWTYEGRWFPRPTLWQPLPDPPA